MSKTPEWEYEEQISALNAKIARLTAQLAAAKQEAQNQYEYWTTHTRVAVPGSKATTRIVKTTDLYAEWALVEKERDSLKRHLDAIAEALHPKGKYDARGWHQMDDMWICNWCEIALDAPDEHVCRPGKPAYQPDRLAGMVRELWAKNDKLLEWANKFENDEASVCPEDIGFVEWIGILTKQRDEARLERDEQCELWVKQREQLAAARADGEDWFRRGQERMRTRIAEHFINYARRPFALMEFSTESIDQARANADREKKG